MPVITIAAATAIVTALAAQIAAGGVVSAAQLIAAKKLIDKFGLSGFDVIIAACKTTQVIKERRDRKKRNRGNDAKS